MQKHQKPKLKTLPNQPHSQLHQQYIFQSQSQQNPVTKKLNLASPTFATTELQAASMYVDQEQTTKRNDDLLFNQCNIKGNLSSNKGLTDETNKQNKDIRDNRVRLSLRQFVNNEPSKSQLAFLKGQNQKLVQKCKTLSFQNKHFQQQIHILTQKLKISKKTIQQKYKDAVTKWLSMPNSSKEETNVDIYLELKTFRRDYNRFQEEKDRLEKENVVLAEKVRELEQIIGCYTEKSDKKKNQKMEVSQKLKQYQKFYNQKQQQWKRKQKQLQSSLKQSQKSLSTLQSDHQKLQSDHQKLQSDHQKLQFLKHEIQKKRQQDIQTHQHLQQYLKQKQSQIYTLKQQLLKQQQQNHCLNTKLLACKDNKNMEQKMENQLVHAQEEIGRLGVCVVGLEAQNGKLRFGVENMRVVNQKYGEEIGQLRKLNQGYYEKMQQLKLQKGQLQSIIQKHISSQQRQAKKIQTLQQKYNETQKCLQQIKLQFQLSILNNRSQTARAYPQVSKFGQKTQQIVQESQRTSQNQDSDKNYIQNAIHEEKIRKIEEKFNKIVEELNQEIQELRKVKDCLEGELESQRQRVDKINIQLQDTYRKMEELGNTYNYNDFDNYRDKDRFSTGGINKRGQFYGTGNGLPLELARTTKAVPQLKMIREILASILSSTSSQKTNKIILQNKENTPNLQQLIDEVKKMSQQTADLFDIHQKQLQILTNRIYNKEEVISKLLRFTPQQKKICILQYLRVMENIDDYAVEQVYKVTVNLEEEANQWKKYVNAMADELEKNQEEILSLKKQINKIKNQGAREMRMEPRIENRKQQNWNIGRRQRPEKIDRDRYEAGFQKYDYRRY